MNVFDLMFAGLIIIFCCALFAFATIFILYHLVHGINDFERYCNHMLNDIKEYFYE